MNTVKKLYQRKDGAIVSGLCNGIADYFGVDATLVRVCWVGLSLVASPGAIFAYAILAFIVPYSDYDESNTCMLDMQKLKPLMMQGDVRALRRYFIDAFRRHRAAWAQATR